MSNLVAEPIVSKKEDKFVAVICSIFPEGDEREYHTVNRSYHPCHVNICKPGEDFATTVIEPVVTSGDIGNDRKQEFRFTARDVAEDLCQELNGRVMGDPRSFLGYFVCKSLEPSQKELSDAKSRLEKTLMTAIRQADSTWTKMPHHELIHDLARKAAKFYGIDKPWLYKTEVLESCAACGEKLKPNVAVCAACGFVVNKARAIELGIIEKEPKSKKQIEA